MNEWQIIQMLVTVGIIPLIGLVYRNQNANQERQREAIEAALQAQTSSLRTILDGHRAELTGLGGRVSHLENTLADMRVALAQQYTTKNDYSGLTDEIKRLASEVNALARELDKNQISISNRFADCSKNCQGQGKS